HPERFRFVHKDTGAELVAAVMPLKSDARDAREAPLKTHAVHIGSALNEGVPFADALILAGKKAQVSTPVERESYQDDSLSNTPALRYEALRHRPEGGERVRIVLTRVEFGGSHFVAVVGLVAPMDDYTSLLGALSDFTGFVRLAGIPVSVPTGL